MGIELYSYTKHNGFHLFVSVYESDDGDGFLYEGVAQHNGTTLFHNGRKLSGESSEIDLIKQIDSDKELNQC